MADLDKNKGFGIIYGDEDGRCFEQDGKFFDSQGKEITTEKQKRGFQKRGDAEDELAKQLNG